MNRRQLLRLLPAAALLFLPRSSAQKSPPTQGKPMTQPAQPAYRMPDEAEPHVATWMAYGATAGAWGTGGSYGASRVPARHDLMRVAVNLSRFEEVRMLVSRADMPQARQFLAAAKAEAHSIYAGGETLAAIEAGGPIHLIEREVNDLWVRDTGAVFVWQESQQSGKKLAGVDFHFNGWGQENTGAAGWRRDPQKAKNGIEWQEVAHDRKVAAFILAREKVPTVPTWLVLEGGGLEVDGHGTAICTESCILNPNRNPGRSKAEVEAELRRVLGIRKVIWLPGVRAHDITDGHIDFYARFVGPGQVVYGLDNDPDSSEYAVTHQNEKLLRQATDAQGRKLQLTPLLAPNASAVQKAVLGRTGWKPSQFNADIFAAGYIGFYVANGCVLMAQFGDPKADRAAYDVLAKLYPDRVVMQISTDGLANGGGTIHCATQQQPKSIQNA